jgi:RimJ/RimL family protein N-acetyltransferase
VICLRTAALADCELVWMWNFAADVRAMSGDPTIIELSRHAAWYGRRIAETAAPMWIVEYTAPPSGGAAGRGQAPTVEAARAPVGVVRIDADGRMSIALGADARGRGIGKRAILAACAAWSRPVTAEIRHDNSASRACFEACGFVVQTAPPSGGADGRGQAPPVEQSRAADLITYTWSP